jgi:Leucine-rich repeat (LRR) protein
MQSKTFNYQFEFVIITYICWPIECTSKPSFIGVSCLSLQELPTSIGQLNVLQKLNMHNCSKLQELPTFVGQLNALQNLYLNHCSRLQELLTSIGQVSALQNHHLDNYSRLQELPASFKTLICTIVQGYKNYVHLLPN